MRNFEMDVVFDGDFLNEKLRPKEKFILRVLGNSLIIYLLFKFMPDY
jgi:hypothetical protein